MSTGNTPTRSDPDDYEPFLELDTYKPSPTVEPQPEPTLSTTARRVLLELDQQLPFLSLLYGVMAEPRRALTYDDIRAWHVRIDEANPTHEQLKAAMLQAAGKVVGRLRKAREGEGGVEVGPMAYGVPETFVPWTEVNEEVMSRMTPMALRGAIVQAYVAMIKLA